jgi:hypothetical protein
MILKAFVRLTRGAAFGFGLQRPHDADPREHRWPSQFRDQHQALDRGLPFRGE